MFRSISIVAASIRKHLVTNKPNEGVCDIFRTIQCRCTSPNISQECFRKSWKISLGNMFTKNTPLSEYWWDFARLYSSVEIVFGGLERRIRPHFLANALAQFFPNFPEALSLTRSAHSTHETRVSSLLATYVLTRRSTTVASRCFRKSVPYFF